MKAGCFTAGLVVVTWSAGADLIPVSQSRYVASESFIHNAVSSTLRSDDDVVRATDFSEFDRGVTTTVVAQPMIASASASLDSIILSNLIAATGATSASFAPVLDDSLASAQGDSHLEITFVLPVASYVTFEAHVSHLDDLLGVDFYTDDLSVAVTAGWGFGQDVEFAGMLPAGEYNLYAFSQLYVEGYEGDGPIEEVRWWEFRLDVVPGAGTLALVGAAGAVGAGRRRRREA